MGQAISAVQTLESGAGVYAFSGPVACTTSAKSVILQQDSNLLFPALLMPRI